MDAVEFYMSLPHDNSGSISKNRFRNELLWGLQKAYEVYATGKDFVVVFDLACDIEVHIGDTFEFYQLKTHRAKKAYTVSDIIDKGKGTQSILGKLYILKQKGDEQGKPVKASIVSNIPLNDTKAKKVFSDRATVCLNELSEKSLTIVSNRLKEELKIDTNISCDNIFYNFTLMNLFAPNDEILGKTVKFYMSVKKCEPKKPHGLYNSLKEIIEGKACHELTETDYNKIIERKGLTKQELDEILEQYSENTDEAVQKTFRFIDENFQQYNLNIKMRLALKKVVVDRTGVPLIQRIEADILNYIDENIDSLGDSRTDTCEAICKEFDSHFPLEYDDFYKKALTILSLFTYEEKLNEFSAR